MTKVVPEAKAWDTPSTGLGLKYQKNLVISIFGYAGTVPDTLRIGL